MSMQGIMHCMSIDLSLLQRVEVERLLSNLQNANISTQYSENKELTYTDSLSIANVCMNGVNFVLA